MTDEQKMLMKIAKDLGSLKSSMQHIKEDNYKTNNLVRAHMRSEEVITKEMTEKIGTLNTAIALLKQNPKINYAFYSSVFALCIVGYAHGLDYIIDPVINFLI